MEYGLIGEKLSHSFSKIIHEQLASNDYTLCPLDHDEFHTFMKQKAFRAINVTIPYKQDVIPYCDDLDEKAKHIGAVNTIVNKDGKLYGTNTDYDGFLYTLKKHQIQVKNKKVLVLGDGGAAQAIKAVLHDEGCKEIISVRRSIREHTWTYEQAKKQHHDASIVINTSPCGMYPNIHAAPVDLDDFPAVEAVVDIIYNPLHTALCIQAKAKGIPFAGGLEMLIAQAKYAAEYFHDKTISDDVIDRIYQRLYKEKRNIVLIGMPSCGKTTLGKQLADRLHRPFLDLDQALVKQEQRTIKQMIDLDGEAAFRQKESELIDQVSAYQGYVIATGGGCVLHDANMLHLQMNGFLLYIKRPLSLLLVSDDRPLSSSKEAISSLYEQRKERYVHYADAVIENEGDLETILDQMMRMIDTL